MWQKKGGRTKEVEVTMRSSAHLYVYYFSMCGRQKVKVVICSRPSASCSLWLTTWERPKDPCDIFFSIYTHIRIWTSAVLRREIATIYLTCCTRSLKIQIYGERAVCFLFFIKEARGKLMGRRGECGRHLSNLRPLERGEKKETE